MATFAQTILHYQGFLVRNWRVAALCLVIITVMLVVDRVEDKILMIQEVGQE